MSIILSKRGDDKSFQFQTLLTRDPFLCPNYVIDTTHRDEVIYKMGFLKSLFFHPRLRPTSITRRDTTSPLGQSFRRAANEKHRLRMPSRFKQTAAGKAASSRASVRRELGSQVVAVHKPLQERINT
jgi:hypothetical protein